MRFWRIEQLKAEMRAKPLSEREALPYLVVYVALFTLASGLPVPDFNVLDAIGAVVGVAIAVLDSLGRLADDTSVYDFLYMLVAETVVYWRIGYHVRDLANSATNMQTVAEP